MGMDALDILFRLEKSFGVKIPRGRVFEVPPPPTFGFPVKVPGHEELRETGRTFEGHCFDLTAGELHDRLCELMREQGMAIPFSSWHRVKKCLSNALGVSPNRITRESRLITDLDASF